MPLYKYIVANNEGKKLSGTVNAPTEKDARNELNQLGFSVLMIKETTTPESETENPQSHKFIFEALDKTGMNVSGSISSDDIAKAQQRLTGEYNLSVTAIWPEGADEKIIQQARSEGTKRLQESLKQDEITEKRQEELTEDDIQKQQLLKQRVETILTEINQLLKKFENVIELDQKAEINKRIDKLLRIKNSSNFDYILKTAEELLIFIQDQEKSLIEKGFQDQRIELKLTTNNLLSQLNIDTKPQSLSEDILNKISKWEKTQSKVQEPTWLQRATGNILASIKAWFETPREVMILEQQIKAYNKQIWEFITLYFKEPTPEYKNKIKNSIKTVWQTRKIAKVKLKEVKKLLEIQKRNNSVDEKLVFSFISETNMFTGWLLTFYVIYYILGIYLSTKDFGLNYIPKGFIINNSIVFKYILVILFLLHASTALKINFFQKSTVANVVLPMIFLTLTILTLLNF